MASMNRDEEKLGDLADIWGLSVDALLRGSAFDSVAPAICMAEGCDAVYEYEPDCRDGWCDECGSNTVMSGLVLGAVI